MWRKQPRINLCCLNSCSTAGRSTNFTDFVQQFQMRSVTRMSASRSCAESPKEMTFLRPSATSVSQNFPISCSKARYFHSNGDATPCCSYDERAEIVETPSRAWHRDGMNLRQLASIQPSSAFVTMTTLPWRFATARVRETCPASLPSMARCVAVGAGSSSRMRPRSVSHVEGSSVSSQSKIIIVSSAANGGGSSLSLSSLLLPEDDSQPSSSVERSEENSSAPATPSLPCAVCSCIELSAADGWMRTRPNVTRNS
mmetsp:Transcript_9248/g.27731  ORF Transcript_9248/g.27731 Transcript_9248/m.27731 type:complete len:256 (-) Transcript_9248:45-812(-)